MTSGVRSKTLKGKGKYIIVLVAIFLLLTIGAFSRPIFQEGNPLPLFLAIMKLKYSKSYYVEFSSAPNRYISKSKADERYSPVIYYMNNRNWDFKEQMGSGLVFERDGELTVVSTRQYSRFYYIWNTQME